MNNNRKRYAVTEQYITLALIVASLFLVFYLAAAGSGVIWLKILLAIVAILICGLCLAFLYLSKELLKQRSLWMTVAAAAVIICILASLILNYPSPHPAEDFKDKSDSHMAIHHIVN